MTYDPPHRNQPPPQGRWPGATPAEPWQAYREEDSYPYGVPAAADRQDSYWATASVGSGSQAGYTDAARGAADRRPSGYQPSRAAAPFPGQAPPFPGSADPFPGPADPFPGSADPFPGPADSFPDPADSFPGRVAGYASPPPGRHSASGYPALGDGYAEGQRDWDQTDPNQRSWQTSDWGQQEWGGNSYRDAGTGEYGAQASQATQTGYGAQTGYGDEFDGGRLGQDYGRAQNGYADATQGYGGELDGYRAPDGYRGPDGYPASDEYQVPDGYRAPDEYRAPDGYPARDGYPASDEYQVPDGYRAPDEYATSAGYDIGDDSPGVPGYAGTRDNFGGTTAVAEAPYSYYRDPDSSAGVRRASTGALLTAPDADVYPEGWQADQENRRESRRRGLLVGAMTGVLATATASAVSILAAAFVRPQASPILAVYDVFTDRMPAFMAAHFGTHGRSVLLLGLYISIALLGLVIGMLARRAAALGVAGLAVLSVLGAFVTITRPQGQVTDVLPAVAGGLVGVLALLWLRRASAPIVALRPAPGDGPRRAR
jgi:hypothetical protein